MIADSAYNILCAGAGSQCRKYNDHHLDLNLDPGAFSSTALASGEAMPTLNPQTDSLNRSLSLANHHQSESQLGEIFQMKEFSLIQHIEALKSAAKGQILFPDVNNSANPNSNFNSLLPISSSGERTDIAALKCKPKSAKWAIDPASVPGNLRKTKTPETKISFLTTEDILSQSSSISGKTADDFGEPLQIQKSVVKARLKLSKSSKKKTTKRKGSNGFLSPALELDTSKSTNYNAFSKYSRNNKSNSHCSGDNSIDALTALCKGIKIQEKVVGSINIKKAPYSRKTSVSTVQALSTQSKLSPARTSLGNAIIEYSKKVSVSSDPGPQRKTSSKEEEAKTTKVFLSEKQSGVISDCGMVVPCAPPATPTPEQLRRIEYVPSLQDIRSQRSIRHRLQMMEARALKKEKRKHEECVKAEVMTMREKKIELKRRQRLEIYALNKVMTDLENERFHQFMSSAGPNI